MIRQAAAYATAASIGSLVGTLAGILMGAGLVALAYENKKSVVNNLSSTWPKLKEDTDDGHSHPDRAL